MKRRSNLLRTWVRVVLALYTSALLTATHWPGLTIEGPIDRTDLVIHAGVLFWWTVLLYGSGLIASGGCGCLKRRLVWTGVAGFAFAVFDESTQPMFHRVFDPLDLAADFFGVAIAIAGIALCRRRWGGAMPGVGE